MSTRKNLWKFLKENPTGFILLIFIIFSIIYGVYQWSNGGIIMTVTGLVTMIIFVVAIVKSIEKINKYYK